MYSHENTFNECLKLSYDQVAAIINSSGDRKSHPDSSCTIWTSVEYSTFKQMMPVDRNKYKTDSKADKSTLNLTAFFFIESWL